MLDGKNLSVIGLDDVDLPLAVEVGKFRRVVGVDIGLARRRWGRATKARWGSRLPKLLKKQLTYSNCLEEIADHGAFIVTVPKPVARANRRIWLRWSAPFGPLAER